MIDNGGNNDNNNDDDDEDVDDVDEEDQLGIRDGEGGVNKGGAKEPDPE